MSYGIKYASSFFGPFRDAVILHLLLVTERLTKWTANRLEAFRELESDLKEGDMMIVKPALSYLDIVRDVKTIQIFLLLLIT